MFSLSHGRLSPRSLVRKSKTDEGFFVVISPSRLRIARRRAQLEIEFESSKSNAAIDDDSLSTHYVRRFVICMYRTELPRVFFAVRFKSVVPMFFAVLHNRSLFGWSSLQLVIAVFFGYMPSPTLHRSSRNNMDDPKIQQPAALNF
jgi:hypothetical protein